MGMGSSSQVSQESCPHLPSSRPASRSRQPSPTSDVLRGTATSPTQFSATNTTTVSTTSQRTGCAQTVLSLTPSAERGSLAITTSTSTVATDLSSSPPRVPATCELGLVYNELSKQCDAPENVPECKDYYAF